MIIKEDLTGCITVEIIRFSIYQLMGHPKACLFCICCDSFLSLNLFYSFINNNTYTLVGNLFMLVYFINFKGKKIICADN